MVDVSSNHKKDYFWNTLAGLINASEAIILGIVITRTNGLVDAGILSLAFAVGNLFKNIGLWGIGGFQVSDVSGQYSSSVYYSAHIISAIVMFGCYTGYIFYGILNGYSITKSITILMICLIYTIESMENFFGTFYQQMGKMYIGGVIFSIRWSITMLLFSLTLYITRDLCIASILGAAVCIFLEYICIKRTFPSFGVQIRALFNKEVFYVLMQCLPLCLVGFCIFYVTNAPKFAIDRYFPDDVQACYGFVAMPVFVIELLNSFIYAPLLVNLSAEWENRRYSSFIKRILFQCVVIFGLTMCCILGAYLIGIPVLSFVFSTDLSEYKFALIVLLVAGAFLAFAGFFNIILTIMRKQKYLLGGYIFIALLALIFCNPVVRDYGVNGVCIFYTVLIAFVAGGFGGLCFCFIDREKRKIG